MDEILELSRRLGEAIKETERWEALRAASEAMLNNEEAQRIAADYERAADELEDKAERGEELTGEDEQRMDDLQELVDKTPPLAAYLQAQADFHELMHEVYMTIDREIGAQPES